ncbi:MAG: winged helix-turn-helix domain-containing protein [Pirellulaceae bacterium]
MRISDLEVDSVRLRATRAGRELDLTPKEFALLSLLIQRAGELVPRTLIAQHVWQVDFSSKSKNLNALVRRLRAKVDEPFPPRLIHTVRGAGYYLEQLH